MQAALLLLALMTASPPAGEAEQIFSCSFGARQIEIVREGATLVYRYGRPGRPELVLRGGRRIGDELPVSKWPAHLPSPLFTLHPGDTARIDWNGRFAFGSNHSSYYEQHIYWLAMADAVEPRLFLDATPRKHVDLRGDIY